MSDALLLLLRVNLAAGAGVALAMLLRRPVRRLFGARVAYGLWSLAPLFAAAMLAPARVVTVVRPASPAQVMVSTALDPSSVAMGLWAAGALAALAWLIRRQAQFGRAMRAGRAGPAAVGVFRPRIVVPDDFAQRYTLREQRVVLAHEATHIARHDPRINALVALGRCIGWFNPLAHLMARELRLDQELACDAQVVAAHPAARRSYAEAMLKTQLAGRPLPLGCYWPSPGMHPLAERIALLSRQAPSLAGRRLGGAVVMLLAVAGASTVWALRPPQVVLAAQALETPAQDARLVAASEPGGGAPGAEPSIRRPALQSISTAPAPPQAEPPQPAPTPAMLTEAVDQPAAASPERRLLPPGVFGPSKVRGLANWSSVEPGLAVRVLATMVDPDGIQLTTDLTSFGSQSRYRLGYIERGPSRYKLFTTVVQHGDRLQVTAGLNRALGPLASGSIELAPGETGTIRLPGGQLVTVTPAVRPETPEEMAEGRGRPRVDVFRDPQPS